MRSDDLAVGDVPRLASGEVCYPRGWFVLAGSEELDPGDIRPLRYFGRDLVLFRTHGGVPVVMDAHCPHLGAHLGVGGRVEGEALRCPFHGWCFGADGECLEVPYAKRIPAQARTGTYPVRDINGLIMMWFDHDQRRPDFDIPVLPEWGAAGWSGWNLHRMDIATHPREIVENVADSAHFEVVHRFDEMVAFDNIYDGHTATQLMCGRSPVGETETRATYYGPGYQITWMDALFEVRLLNAHTPIDANRLHLFFGVMIRRAETVGEQERENLRQRLALMDLPEDYLDDPDNIDALYQAYVETTRQGYYDDVAIWEHKLYRRDPVFCDGDGPIARLRRWYGQFYQTA